MDFSVGDVVVCVDVTPIPLGNVMCPYLKLGAFYRVERVWRDSGGGLIKPQGIRPGTCTGGYCCSRFRKIEAPKSEIADRIKSCRPIRKRVGA